MLRNWQCDVLSRVRNGLTFHLSLSACFRHAPVRLHRTASAAFGQLRSRCGQLISEMTPCVQSPLGIYIFSIHKVLDEG